MGIIGWIIALFILVLIGLLVPRGLLMHFLLSGKFKTCPKCSCQMAIKEEILVEHKRETPVVKYLYFCRKCGKHYIDEFRLPKQ
jgi:hypothetical protein